MPERLRRLRVNCAFPFRTGNRNGEIRFASRAVNVRISRNEKPVLNRRTERLDNRRIHSRSGDGVFVRIGRLDRTENDQHN